MSESGIKQGGSHMFLFNKREVYIGRSISESARVRDILLAHNIPFQIKIISHLGQWTGRGTIRSNSGSVGVNLDLDRQTYIYVKKKDYEEAAHFIRTERNAK